MTQPRHWFQIHLSTAVVMMFFAGGLLFLNLRPESIVESSFESSRGYIRVVGPGWPAPVWTLTQMGPDEQECIRRFHTHRPNMKAEHLLWNVVIGAALMTSACSLSEYFIRRRATR